MPSLIQTNPYLKDAKLRKQRTRENVYESSIVEGAKGLKSPYDLAKARSKASTKKAVKGT